MNLMKTLWADETSNIIDFVRFACQIFTLSALPLHRMPMVIKECFSVLKPGGILLFRDYGNRFLKYRGQLINLVGIYDIVFPDAFLV